MYLLFLDLGHAVDGTPFGAVMEFFYDIFLEFLFIYWFFFGIFGAEITIELLLELSKLISSGWFLEWVFLVRFIVFWEFWISDQMLPTVIQFTNLCIV